MPSMGFDDGITGKLGVLCRLSIDMLEHRF